MRLLMVLATLAAVPGWATAQLGFQAPVRVRTLSDFPLGLPLVEGEIIALDRLQAAATNPPEKNINKRFNQPGPQNIYRWKWLTAKRRNLDYYDGLTREAVYHEKEFWQTYAAAIHTQKDAYKHYGHDFRTFQYRRIILREEWYYTAKGHHFRWEEDRLGGPVPLIRQTERKLCRALGCTTIQLEHVLAWMDLFATEVLPGHMSLWLTIPLSLLS